MTLEPERPESIAEHSAPALGLVSMVFKVMAPTAVITALLYYFGWARTDAAARRAGVDQSLFGFSTNDYLLRSVGPLFKPFGLGLLAVAVIAVALGGIRTRVRRRISDGSLPPHRVNHVGWGLLAVSAAATTGAALLLPTIRTQTPGHSAALLMFVGAATLGGALSLADVQRGEAARSELRRHQLGREDEQHEPAQLSDLLSPQRGWLLGVVVALVVVGLFAATLRLAFEDGEASIVDYARTIDRQPSVIITSTQPLDIDLPGVESHVLLPSAKYRDDPRYRYSGLHLLLEANQRLFLVTRAFGRSDEAWAVAVVPYTENLRLDFVGASP